MEQRSVRVQNIFDRLNPEPEEKPVSVSISDLTAKQAIVEIEKADRETLELWFTEEQDDKGRKTVIEALLSALSL